MCTSLTFRCSEVENVSSEERNSRLKPNEVLKMLQPIIADNQNMIWPSRPLMQRISVACWSFLRMSSGVDGGIC